MLVTGYPSLAYNMNLSGGYGTSAANSYASYNQGSYGCLGYAPSSFTSPTGSYGQDPLATYGSLASGLTGTDPLSLKSDNR